MLNIFDVNYNNNHKDDNNNNNNIVFVRATTISGSATGMSSPGSSGETLNVAAEVAATVVASGADTKTIKDVGNTIDKTNNNPTNIKNNNDSGTTKITTRTPSSPTRNSPTSPPSDASNQQAIDIPTSSSSSQVSSSSSSSATATDTESAMVDENISSATGVTLETTKNVTTTPSKVVKKKKRPYIAAIPTEVDDTRMNYAAKSAGAVIIDSSKDFKYKGNILDDVESNYALVPCASKHKYVTISLSEDAQVDGISLKNAEAYSGTLTDVQVLGSAKYPTKQWTLLGEINVENNNNKQSFKLPRPAWINFVKLRFRSHYGDEFYCTLTRVIINGQSMMDAVQKTLDEASFIDEDEDEDGLYNDDDDNKYGNDAAVSTTATTTTTVTATATSDTASSTSTTTASDQNDIDESNNVYTEMDDGSDEERSQVESQDLENVDTNAENGNRNLLHDTKGDVIDEHNHLADSNRINENIDNEVEINANGQVSEASNSENNLQQNENEDFREDSDTLSRNANNAGKAASSLTASDSSTDGASSASNGNLRTDNNNNNNSSEISASPNIKSRGKKKNNNASTSDNSHKIDEANRDSKLPSSSNMGTKKTNEVDRQHGNNSTKKNLKHKADENTRSSSSSGSSSSNSNNANAQTASTAPTTTSSATKKPIVTSSSMNKNNKPGGNEIEKKKKKVSSTGSDKMKEKNARKSQKKNDGTNNVETNKNSKGKKKDDSNKKINHQAASTKSKRLENKSKTEKSSSTSGGITKSIKNDGKSKKAVHGSSDGSNTNNAAAAKAALEAAQAKQKKEMARNEEKKAFNSLLPTPPTLESKHKKIELPRSGAQIENIFSTLSKKVSYVEKDERQLRRNLIDTTVGYNTIMNSFNEKLLDVRDQLLIYTIRTKIAEDKVSILEKEIEVLITWCKILSFGVLLVLVMHLYLVRRRKVDSDNLSIVVDEIRDLREV